MCSIKFHLSDVAGLSSQQAALAAQGAALAQQVAHTTITITNHHHTITTLSPTLSLSPHFHQHYHQPYVFVFLYHFVGAGSDDASGLPCPTVPSQWPADYHCLVGWHQGKIPSLSLSIIAFHFPSLSYHNAVFSFISWMASILLLYLVSPPSSFKSPPVFTLRSYLSPFIVSPLKLYLSRSFPLMLYFSFSPPWNFYLPLSSDAFTLSSGHSSKFLIFSARQNFHASRLLQPILKSNDSCHRIRGNFRKCQYRWAPDRCKNLENK